MRTTIIISIAAFVIIISGCSTSHNSSNAAASLMDTKWTLTTLNNKDVKTDKVYVLFIKETAKLNGDSFCNRYFGSFSFSDAGSLSVSNFGSTKMNCDDESKEIEYFAAIQNAKSYQLSNNILSLSDGTKTTAVFKVGK